MPHRLTVLATTDVHGNALSWDYYADRPFEDHEVGLAKLATVVERRRAELGWDAVVLVDNGDTLQGTPLDTYFAQQEPIVETGAIHPMAAAFNAMRYDVVNLGNHEFNYGFAHLHRWDTQLDASLLGTNVSRHDGSGAGFLRFAWLDRRPASWAMAQIVVISSRVYTPPDSVDWVILTTAGWTLCTLPTPLRTAFLRASGSILESGPSTSTILAPLV